MFVNFFDLINYRIYFKYVYYFKMVDLLCIVFDNNYGKLFINIKNV